jgi:predicted HicB family RNase H-like nuclease
MKTWEQYTYRVAYSPEDGEYVALCAELSGLSWLAATPEAALRGIRRAARDGVEVLRSTGAAVPEPIATRSFSGIFKVRVPPEVHRQLALDAAEQAVSMNRLVSAKLSRLESAPAASGRAKARRAPAREPAPQRPPTRRKSVPARG